MFCKECGAKIEEDSKFCRQCGAKQGEEGELPALETPHPALMAKPSDAKSGSKKGYLWAGGIILLLIVIGLQKDPVPQSDLDSGNAPLAAEGSEESPAATTPTATDAWSYSTDEDKVRGATTYYARTVSTNSIFQSSPYDSETTMTMTVRKSPAYGTDVLLSISSGQLMCPSYKGCSGKVRVDDGPAQTINFNGPSDSSSDTIFVVGAKGFIGKLKKAKKVIVEKTLYNAGNPQFEFDVGGLKWDH